MNYGRMSKGGISNGALNSMNSCGFISRSYLSNCLVVFGLKFVRIGFIGRGIGGNPILMLFDLALSIY